MEHWYIDPDVAPHDLPRELTMGGRYSDGKSAKIDRPYNGRYSSFGIEDDGHWHGYATHIQGGCASQFNNTMRQATPYEIQKWRELKLKAIKYMSTLLRENIWK